MCKFLFDSLFYLIIYMINAFTVPSLFPLILPVGAIVGFLMYNLGVLGDQRTVFLGDNGSQLLLGFYVYGFLFTLVLFESFWFFSSYCIVACCYILLDAVRVILWLEELLRLNANKSWKRSYSS